MTLYNFPIVQQAVAQLPWGHNLVLPTKLKTPDERVSYTAATITNGDSSWSRHPTPSVALDLRILDCRYREPELVSVALAPSGISRWRGFGVLVKLA